MRTDVEETAGIVSSGQFFRLLLSGKLMDHPREIDREANELIKMK